MPLQVSTYENASGLAPATKNVLQLILHVPPTFLGHVGLNHWWKASPYRVYVTLCWYYKLRLTARGKIHSIPDTTISRKLYHWELGLSGSLYGKHDNVPHDTCPNLDTAAGRISTFSNSMKIIPYLRVAIMYAEYALMCKTCSGSP